jgi:hypothetical protein
MFLIAFTCAVASVSSASSFQCSDKTQVQLAAVRAAAPVSLSVVSALNAQRLRCQGFDSNGPGHLIATCRFANGSFVGCTMVEKGLAVELPERQRHYGLPSCAQRAARRAKAQA